MSYLQLNSIPAKTNAKVFLPNADINPEWNIGQKEQKRLIEIWNKMKSYDVKEINFKNDIFYTGCQYNLDDGRNWFAYKGITVMRDGKITEVKKDENRNFEKKILKTAPKNVVPDVLFITEFNNNISYNKRKTG